MKFNIGVSAWVGLLASCLLGATPVRADNNLVLSDGSQWEQSTSGPQITRVSPAPVIKVSLQIHRAGISCAAGIGPGATVKAPYLPANFHPFAIEEQQSGGVRATVCSDAGTAAFVAVATWSDGLSPADSNSLRLMLGNLHEQIKAATLPPSTLKLFHPEIARVPLNGRTGVWDFLADKIDASSMLILRTWPLGSAAGARLSRSPGTQFCDSVGFKSQPRPAWAPAAFYPYGATIGQLTMACLDTADGHVLLAETQSSQSAEADAQLKALLEEITLALGTAPPRATSNSQPIPETEQQLTTDQQLATDRQPATDPPYGDSGTDKPAELNSYAATDKIDFHPRGGRPRWHLAVHHFESATVSAAAPTEYYLLGLSYRRAHGIGDSIGSLAAVLDYAAAAAINSEADLALDARAGAAAGLRLSYQASVLGTAGLGFDGYGIGADSDGTVPTLDSELYGYVGGRVQYQPRWWLALEGWLTKVSRRGPVDETRYGFEFTIHQHRGASVALGFEHVEYVDFAVTDGVTLGLRR